MISQTKADRARNLRYKRPALLSFGYDHITDELYEINEACADVQWFVETDNETILNALDGDNEAEYEFRIAFADLQSKSEELNNALADTFGYYNIRDCFDTCTVALIGNRYRTVGYDWVEEDYFSLTSFEQDLAYTESGQKLMRMTKPQMISTIGQCLGIVIAFLDLRQQYDYLKATFDILRDENTSVLKIIKEIEAAYDAAYVADFAPYREECKRFEALLTNLPDRIWIE